LFGTRRTCALYPGSCDLFRCSLITTRRCRRYRAGVIAKARRATIEARVAAGWDVLGTR
jgi:hypothetical protein